MGKKPSSRQIFLFNDALLVSKAKRQADAHGDSLFCAFYDLHQARIVDHADTADFSNAFELHHKDQGTSMMFCTSGLEEKRAWLKEIKAIIKEFQHQDYNANKETLIRGMIFCGSCGWYVILIQVYRGGTEREETERMAVIG